MNENTTQEPSSRGQIPVKNVLRVLSLLVIIIFFVPTFLVSCSGQEVELSAYKAMVGVKVYGETVVEPYLVMILLLLLPIAMLAVLFMKKMSKKITKIVLLSMPIVDLILWIIFSANTKAQAAENYCEFKVTAWFVINILCLLLFIILSTLMFIDVMDFETDILSVCTKDGIEELTYQISNKIGLTKTKLSKGTDAPKDQITGFCTNCGAGIKQGNEFCVKCGVKISSETIISDEKESKKQETISTQEEVKERYCINCGAKLDDDAVFCDSCGNKVM